MDRASSVKFAGVMAMISAPVLASTSNNGFAIHPVIQFSATKHSGTAFFGSEQHDPHVWFVPD